MQIRKPVFFFCFFGLVKKREAFAFECEHLREKGRCIPALVLFLLMSPQNFEKPIPTLEKPLPAYSMHFGTQKTTRPVHKEEHLLSPLPF